MNSPEVRDAKRAQDVERALQQMVGKHLRDILNAAGQPYGRGGGGGGGGSSSSSSSRGGGDGGGGDGELSVDVVVASEAFTGAADIAEAARAMLVTAAAVPIIPTGDFPFMMMSTRPSLPFRWLNRATYAATKLARSMAGVAVLREWRVACLGLDPATSPAPSRFLDFGRRSDTGGPCAARLCFVSPAVLPRPSDWGPEAHMVGYWFLDRISNINSNSSSNNINNQAQEREQEAWRPDAALQQFLDDAAVGGAGSTSVPVVYVRASARVCVRACVRTVRCNSSVAVFSWALPLAAWRRPCRGESARATCVRYPRCPASEHYQKKVMQYYAKYEARSNSLEG